MVRVAHPHPDSRQGGDPAGREQGAQLSADHSGDQATALERLERVLELVADRAEDEEPLRHRTQSGRLHDDSCCHRLVVSKELEGSGSQRPPGLETLSLLVGNERQQRDGGGHRTTLRVRRPSWDDGGQEVRRPTTQAHGKQEEGTVGVAGGDRTAQAMGPDAPEVVLEVDPDPTAQHPPVAGDQSRLTTDEGRQPLGDRRPGVWTGGCRGQLALHLEGGARLRLVTASDEPGGDPADGHEGRRTWHLDQVEPVLLARPDAAPSAGVRASAPCPAPGQRRRASTSRTTYSSHWRRQPFVARPVVSSSSPPSRNGAGSSSSLVATQRSSASGCGRTT